MRDYYQLAFDDAYFFYSSLFPTRSYTLYADDELTADVYVSRLLLAVSHKFSALPAYAHLNPTNSHH